jgi:hypothetical protein
VSAVARIALFLGGVWLVYSAAMAAVRTFVLPRAAFVAMTRAVFVLVRDVFRIRLRWSRNYATTDRIMALYAPIALLLLPAVWLVFVVAGYTAMFRAAGVGSWNRALRASISSGSTLGFERPPGTVSLLLAFSEAALGLALLALLITYLPTMYAAFSRRETAVALLEAPAGSPPSAETMLRRYQAIEGLDLLEETFVQWQQWFADVAESHTSLGALAFFRSPRPEHSWVTAAGAVLDAAALRASTLDLPRSPPAELCLRVGYLALRHIADFFTIPYDRDPAPTDAISVTRAEYEVVYDRLAAAGLPLRPDRNQAWSDFAGWRVNYDRVLIGLASLTEAPVAPWSSDRAPAFRRRPVRQRSPRVHRRRG